MLTNFEKKLRPRSSPKYINGYIERGGNDYLYQHSADTFTSSGFNQSFFIINKPLFDSRRSPSS